MISSILVSSVVSGVCIYFNEIKKRSSKVRFLLFLIIFLAIFLRLYNYPLSMGLNQDEAQGGYEAWSLAHYGVDQHLIHNPVYFISWGSGMNALYLYIGAPFVKFLGLSLTTYRLPMVITNILAIMLLIYAFSKSQKDVDLLVKSALLFLSPITITSARWAVESNLVIPIFMILYALFLLFINSKNRVTRITLFALFIITISLSAYAYSTLWLFLVIFYPLILGYLFYIKKINFKFIIFALIINLIICWPLLAYVYVNYFGGHQFQIFGLTITKMYVNRTGSQFVISQGNTFLDILRNIKENIVMYLKGNDGYIENALPIIGMFYPGMILFAVIGIFISLYKHLFSEEMMFMLITLIAAIPSLCIIIPNAIHNNSITLAIVYFEAIGILYFIENQKFRLVFSTYFSLMVIIFGISYFKLDQWDLQNTSNVTPVALAKPLKQTRYFKGKVYIISDHPTYPIVRFYNPISPYKFNKESHHGKKAEFVKYYSYGKYNFKKSLNTTEIHRTGEYLVKKDRVKHGLLKVIRKKRSISDYYLFRIY